MKKELLISILFLFLITQANAQTSVYHAFPDSDAVWNVTHTVFVPCGNAATISDFFSYTFSGDTNINGRYYHKFFIPYVQKLDTCSFLHILPGYSGCIRQDIGAKKVYFIPPDSSTEYILYDFNLQPGDAVPAPPSFSCGGSIIKNIDSVLIGSTYRKVWTTFRNGTITDTAFIEGIGYTSGLLAPCSLFDGNLWQLACFQQNGSILYHADTAISCNIIASLNQFSETVNTISIYPNPTTGTFIISMNKNIKQGVINVFNIMGEKVFSEPFMGRQKTLNLNLPPAIYFLQVINGFEIRECRFIKE